jgi:DNA (cytosine-5)-methyltransferase 1
MGYHRAGFDVVGVDIKPQPNYPFEFIQDDASTGSRMPSRRGLRRDPRLAAVPVVHRLPPQGHGVGDGYPDLIAGVREALIATGLPYVIENVPGAPLENPVQVCGTGLGLDVQRHRLFESSFPLMGVPCSHGRHGARFPAATNRGENTRRTVEIGVWRIPLEVQQRGDGHRLDDARGTQRGDPAGVHRAHRRLPDDRSQSNGEGRMSDLEIRVYGSDTTGDRAREVGTAFSDLYDAVARSMGVEGVGLRVTGEVIWCCDGCETREGHLDLSARLRRRSVRTSSTRTASASASSAASLARLAGSPRTGRRSSCPTRRSCRPTAATGAASAARRARSRASSTATTITRATGPAGRSVLAAQPGLEMFATTPAAARRHRLPGEERHAA